MHDLVRALSEGREGDALAVIRTVSEQGIDQQLYLSLVLEYLRQILLLRHAPELAAALKEELGEDMHGDAVSLAQLKDSKLSHETLKLFLDAAGRIRFSPIPSLPLELAVFELSRP